MNSNNYNLTKFFLIIISILLGLFILDSLLWHKSTKQEEAISAKQRIVIPLKEIK